MREQAVRFDLESERRDPRALYRMLKGGYAPSSRVRFGGLDRKVLSRIAAAYVMPKPLGYSTDSRAPGDERRDYYGVTHEEVDVMALAHSLRSWLGIDVEFGTVIERERLIGLTKRAIGRATRWLSKPYTPENEREKAYELIVIFLSWLGRSCDHAGAIERRGGRVLECPDCGSVEVVT